MKYVYDFMKDLLHRFDKLPDVKATRIIAVQVRIEKKERKKL